MRRTFVCGNWKMHKTAKEALLLVKQLLIGIDATWYDKVEVAVAPPFVYLFPLSRLLAGTPIGLSAQDVFWEGEGAFTGEVSPVMLKDLECRYCIVGHSERRIYFGEKDKDVNKKVRALISQGITPIVCVGERLEEREAGKVKEVVEGQIKGALDGVEIASPSDIVIAYEPVWAIGTGKVATPEDAQEVHAFIRELLKSMWGKLADEIRILYGGSVKPDNVAPLVAQPDIDGALVGGASLKAESFVEIVKNAGGF